MTNRDHGLTLIEVVVALSLLGFALVGLLGGLGSTVLLSVSAADRSRTEGALRMALTTLESKPFVPCATSYALGPDVATEVLHWTSTGWSSVCSGSTPQRITIFVDDLTLEVVKTGG